MTSTKTSLELGQEISLTPSIELNRMKSDTSNDQSVLPEIKKKKSNHSRKSKGKSIVLNDMFYIFF